MNLPHIEGVPTSVTAFVGRASTGPLDQPRTVSGLAEFEQIYGPRAPEFPMSCAVAAFYANGGSQAVICRVESFSALPGDRVARTGMYLLENIDSFNLLCIPWDERGSDVPPAVWRAAAQYCVDRRAILIADSPRAWTQHAQHGDFARILPTDLGIDYACAHSAAVYFPGVEAPDSFPVCGAIAGIYTANDAARGVWHAPAGIETGLAGVDALEFNVTDSQNGLLNAAGVNCLRTFPVYGTLVWGARTLRGSDADSDENKYVSVRRLMYYIEDSVYRGTEFAAFEPNDERLWAEVRSRVAVFLTGLRVGGAFDQYLVRCDRTTMTQDDVAAGRCNIVILISPVRPNEFIEFTVTQSAGAFAA